MNKGFTNKRNSEGVKDSIDCYLTIKGRKYTAWSDFITKREAEKESPNDTFIARKQRGGFTRIYKLIN